MRDAIEVYGIAFLLALSVAFMMVFNNAVVYGGQTLVDLTLYGEMVFELLLLNLVVWPIISVAVWMYFVQE